MNEDGLEDSVVADILNSTRRIALVGASNRPNRPSNEVMAALLAHGYHVTPVNPGLAGMTIHGQTVVARLADAAPLDMVDFFRDPNDIAEDVEEAIRLHAKTIWMQIGVVNEDAALMAREAGLNVVMNRCPKLEIPRLGVASLA